MLALVTTSLAAACDARPVVFVLSLGLGEGREKPIVS